jgi:hypothetical protein
MGFQSVVNVVTNFGVPGDIILDEPSRIEPVTLATSGYLGYFFTKANNTDLASVGGTLAAGSVVYGGIAVLPKIEPLYGTSSPINPLNPSLLLEQYSQVALLTFGSCVVNIPNSWEVGDYVQYNTTTGVLGSYAPNGSLTGGYAQVPGGYMTRFGNAASGGGYGIARFNAPN